MNKKLTDNQRSEIYRAWKDGAAVNELAAQYGVSRSAIYGMITKLNKMKVKPWLAEQPKKTQINNEFEDAVNTMIAESKFADSDELPANTEAEMPYSKPLPDFLFDAVDQYIIDKTTEIEEREQRIAELKSEIELLLCDINQAKEWRQTHG